MGVSPKLAPSLEGVHWSIMIPFGTSMNASRIGRVGLGRMAERRDHRIEQRQRQRGPCPAQETRGGEAPSYVSPSLTTLIWNGTLLTMPRMIDDQR